MAKVGEETEGWSKGKFAREYIPGVFMMFGDPDMFKRYADALGEDGITKLFFAMGVFDRVETE